MLVNVYWWFVVLVYLIGASNGEARSASLPRGQQILLPAQGGGPLPFPEGKENALRSLSTPCQLHEGYN